MQSLLILGRQPALGLAELESLYGADKLQPVGDQAVIVDVDPCLLAFNRLGGSLKFCKVLTILETTQWPEIQKFLEKAAPEHAKTMPEGKMHLGLSVFGLDISPQRIVATALSVKKAVQATGRSVRVVPNQELALSSAQVIHNHLVDANGWELVFVRHGNQTICAQTVREQDIASYTNRDRNRPKRDARIGMLPPKLAQIIINLAVGQLPDEARQSVCEIPPDVPIPTIHYTGVYLLDPFCGTGVILQEASLMGYDVYGTDLDKRMIEYAKENMQWLRKQPESQVTFPPENTEKEYVTFETADATSHTWTPKPTVIASETYLGRPFTAMPNSEILAQTAADCNLIIKKFLRNIHDQILPGTRLCLAVPAWQVHANEFKHLPVVDQMADLGYTPVSFVHVEARDLLYYRNDQIVARELIIITRK
jgi:tRNA G10  N-methylase Trm11